MITNFTGPTLKKLQMKCFTLMNFGLFMLKHNMLMIIRLIRINDIVLLLAMNQFSSFHKYLTELLLLIKISVAF